MGPHAIEIFEIIFVLGFAVILHECAHGWVALKFGDPTAKMMGRLTLNPLRHIDPIGTILVPIVSRLILGFPFGWAKPVPVNFMYLRNPKRDMIFVALAGPAVNMAIAVAASFFLALDQNFFSLMIMVNLMLAIFNLTPVPPLDGSRILTGLLPTPLARKYAQLEPFGFIIVIVLLKSGALDFLNGIVISLARMLGVAFG